MGLLKADFYRYLALGFAAGALLVFGTVGVGGHAPLANGLVPTASAAVTQ